MTLDNSDGRSFVQGHFEVMLQNMGLISDKLVLSRVKHVTELLNSFVNRSLDQLFDVLFEVVELLNLRV